MIKNLETMLEEAKKEFININNNKLKSNKWRDRIWLLEFEIAKKLEEQLNRDL